jgi:hypothetical protein
MSYLKAPKFEFFSIQASRIHVPTPHTQNILDNQYHPKHFQMKDRVNARDRDCLWQCFTVRGNDKPRVVRSKLTRKLKIAFHEALAQQNYSREGKSLVEGKANLRYSLDFYPKAATLLASQDQIRAEMTKVVRFLWIEQEGRNGPRWAWNGMKNEQAEWTGKGRSFEKATPSYKDSKMRGKPNNN